jgi:FMN-dependent NADH-azoreductase
MFGFLGITDIEFVRAEGLAYGDDMRTKAISEAKLQISQQFAAA